MPQLLLIEDDSRLAAMVVDYLGQAGFSTHAVGTVEAARGWLRQHRPDAVLMDLMLPDGDGLALTAELRSRPEWRALPILMLTARGDPADRIVGLEMGADDYLPKPYEPRELLARVRALCRRAQLSTVAPERWQLGDLALDEGAREVRLRGQRCELTGHQFDILCILARHAGRVVSREHIQRQLNGQHLEAYDRAIDVHVSRIRAAIEDDPRSPQRLLTVRGGGYMLAR